MKCQTTQWKRCDAVFVCIHFSTFPLFLKGLKGVTELGIDCSKKANVENVGNCR